MQRREQATTRLGTVCRGSASRWRSPPGAGCRGCPSRLRSPAAAVTDQGVTHRCCSWSACAAAAAVVVNEAASKQIEI